MASDMTLIPQIFDNHVIAKGTIYVGNYLMWI